MAATDEEARRHDGTARARSWRRHLAGALATVALAVGVLAIAGSHVVQQHVLDDDLYRGALARADAYERVYTEVLADPELADVVEHLMGELDLEHVDPVAARVYTTNVLHALLPPSRLQQGTQTFLAATLAYIRGDTDSIATDIELRPLLDEMEQAVVREARGMLAAAETVTTTSLSDYGARVGAFAEELTVGGIPDAVPVPPDDVSVEAALAVVLDEVELRTGTDLRAVVDAQTLAGNERDALITAVSPYLAERVAESRGDIQAVLEEGHEFDAIDELADHAERSTRRVLEPLDPLRDAARWFDVPLLLAGIALSLAGIAGLAFLHRDASRRAAVAVASGLVSGGVLVFGAWLALRHGVDPPLGPAVSTGPDSWNLPAGLRAVTGDVESQVVEALDGAVARAALVPVAVGLAAFAVVLVLSAPRIRQPVRALAIATTVALVAGALVFALPSGATATHGCNGHVELCDRAYDQVVYAATHNSMSSPDTVHLWPEHDGTITEQLDHGIRALLLDAHYWPAVRTPEELMEIEPGLPRHLATRVIEEGGDRLTGRDGTFLCHNHCIWGGRPLVDGLTDVRAFLAANPYEVVTLVVQDEVAVPDLVAAFEAAALPPYLYEHDGGAWPTLGEMIDAGRRLVVFAEHQGPPPPWLHPAFQHIQDTPFGFANPPDMSCAPARGPRDASLFMVNHWISRAAPDRSAAVVVNARDFIVERARRCRAERGLQPNFVAVDWYGIGDVVGAVRVLNGLS